MARSEGKKKRKYRVIFVALFCALACYFVACFISLQIRINDREDSIVELRIDYWDKVDENVELRMIIEDENKSAYLERTAREKYGYAKPDERVYYDSSAY